MNLFRVSDEFVSFGRYAITRSPLRVPMAPSLLHVVT